MSEFYLACRGCDHHILVSNQELGKSVSCPVCGREDVPTHANTVPARPMPESPPRPDTIAPTAQPRLLSLDQLRGYAIAGMILVNFLGPFDWTWKVLRHTRDVFSYADTIAPLFIFVVGMGFRISMTGRAVKLGLNKARLALAKRYVILFFVAIVFYGPPMRINWWDALTQISLAGLLSLYFIDKSIRVRIIAAIGYLLLFNVLYLTWGRMGDFSTYAEWMTRRSMNGGPLSPLTYAFVLLFGTIAFDLMKTRDNRKIFGWSAVAVVGMLVAAYVAWLILPRGSEWAIYAEYGDLYSTSKRWSLAPFILISTALCFVAFAFFYWLNDVKGIPVPTLTILGMNPLVIYLLQYALLASNSVYIAKDSHPLMSLFALCLFFGVCYAVAWRLWKDKIFVKL